MDLDNDLRTKNKDNKNFVTVAIEAGYSNEIDKLDLPSPSSLFSIIPWIILGISVFAVYRGLTSSLKDKKK